MMASSGFQALWSDPGGRLEDDVRIVAQRELQTTRLALLFSRVFNFQDNSPVNRALFTVRIAGTGRQILPVKTDSGQNEAILKASAGVASD
ncbi:MAG: hypothetical protein KTR33_13105 [Gammaproteobacteria bacterium]|nr:hypothetical protein [Gammaproteobacteria bacterium]